MPPTSLLRLVRAKSVYFKQSLNRRYLIHILGVCLLLSLVCVEFSAFVPGVDAHSHTAATVNDECASISFSPDGNPFGLCPGPYPTSGGNCVWWAWEQWHLLGYDLPLNWGNAADWAVDAERSGLPLGTTPRVGSIAVFPRADGVWAYGPPGHVAFVTAVSSDGMTFNVTYQNYGDTTPMYVGTGYNVNVINEARYQNGEMRFIYFPKLMDPQLFLRLPGIGTNSPLGVFSANNQFTSAASGTNNITLGLQSASSEDEFNADFTGSGHSDLLLYNRQKGQLNVLTLSNGQQSIPYASRATTKSTNNTNATNQQMVSLADSTTASDKWGSSLDVHVGDFDGSGHAQILLYDRIAGTIQILSLTPQLTIKKHVVLSNWGPGWEVYVGRFDGKRSGLFMYKRYAVPDPFAVSTSTPTEPSPTTAPPVIGPPAGPTNTPTTKPNPTATPKPNPKPTATPKPNPTATPKPNPTSTPVPTATPKPNPTPTPVPTATPQPSPTATPGPTATPSPTTQSAAPTPIPTATPSSTVNPTATPSSTTKSTTPTVTATPSPTVTPSATPTTNSKKSSPSSPSSKAYLDYMDVSPSPTATTGTGDLSGSAPQDWEKKGRTANVVVLDFDQNFNVHVQQSYTLWHANWEVYVGRFASSTQDGVFLYDRLAGEGRIMDFDNKLLINSYQESHNLDGNWMLYSGDFTGVGRSQLFMYDPSSGDGQMLAFKPDLTLANQLTYPKLGKNMVLYGGHFGMPTTGIMLYDVQGSHSTFLAFSKSLAIAQQVTVKSWSQNWQVLVGNFLDHTQCATQENCATRDDILVLDRHTGKIGQYVFSFGRKFKVYDNRLQAFTRLGITIDSRLNKVDSTSFSLIQTLSTSIRDEELY